MSYKAKAQEFIHAINTADGQLAQQLTSDDFKQHNPLVPDGNQVFTSLFQVFAQHGTKGEVIRTIKDGDFVALHNYWKNATPFGASEMVAFDIYSFDENGKINHHWDALMPTTAPNPSGRTLIDGETEVKDLDKTESHKAIVRKLFGTLINGTQEEVGAVVMENFYPDYKQHNPVAGDGIPAIFEAFGQEEWVYLKQHKVIGEGNFVLSICEGTAKGVPSVFYDLVRFDNGKIAEHWDVIQAIPTENVANDNTMFGFKHSYQENA